MYPELLFDLNNNTCCFYCFLMYIVYIFCLKTMFGSSLPPVVCRGDHVLFTLFVLVCVYSCAQCILCCVFALFVFVLCTRCYQFLWIVHSWLFFRSSLTFIWMVGWCCIFFVFRLFIFFYFYFFFNKWVRITICICNQFWVDIYLNLCA